MLEAIQEMVFGVQQMTMKVITIGLLVTAGIFLLRGLLRKLM